MLRPAQRRLVFLTTAFALSLLSCGREVTGPDNGINFGWRLASIALAPEMPTLMQVVEGAGDAVPFTRVRVVLRNEDGSVAKDTLVDFPSDADSVSLALALAIPSSAPATGLPLSLTMAYVNAAGDTVFRAGPSAILARPAGSPGADDPIVIPVRYDGPGKDAVAVVIAPDTGTRVAGTSQAFTATALDAQSQPIANTPFVFFTLDSTRVQVGGATGVATWLPVRGTARIVAALPNGLRADTATFTVALPASQLVLASGGTQTGAVGAALTDSVVVRTLASDGEPARGVVVTFAVASGGGALSTAVDTTDADGKASTRWTLGTTLGAQAITAAAEGLSGSPLAIAATGVAGTPSQLGIVSQPSTSIAGVTMAPAIVVEVRDAFGNVATTFTGDVSVAVAGTPPPTLGGTLTRSAVGGIATFNDLSINVVGAYQLAFTSPDLTPDTTTAISITPAAAAALEFVTQPVGSTAGAAIAPPITVRALDAFGNVATGFTDSVSLALLNSGSAVLSGSAQENAVSGVATFSTLAVNLVGSTYNLAASSTALTPDTSAAFSITAAAPSALVVTAQPAEPRVSGAPFTVGVSAVDAFGNVSNSSTALATISIASGPTGAALSGVTSRALVAGAASFTDLALILAGSYQLAIAAPGLTGVTTGSISVTAGAAAAVTIIAGDAQSGVVNDTLANPLTVEVRDAAGNLVQGASVLWAVASGTANLTVGTVLTDTSGRAATRLVLGTTVASVTVTGTVGTLPAVTFTATSVAGAASSLSIVSGANQQDFATQTLTSPVVLRVRDAFNNVRVGDSVFVSVTVGGGTLGNGVAEDTLISDTQGAVSVTWTLGASAGTQSIQARTGTLAPVTISAVALQSVANAIWTGNVSSSVTEPGNWRNAIVPSATDSVLIPAGRPNYPVLATSVTYSRFTLEDAATIDLASSNLTVTGGIRAPLGAGIIAIEGFVIGQASAGVVAGTFPNLTIEGNYQPLGLVDVVGNLAISGSASFNVVEGDSLHVGGSLITQAGGTFSQSGNSGISVSGDLSLDGGTSLFGAGGRLHLFGNLTTGLSAAATAFRADSAHTVILQPGNTQTITFAVADSIPGGVCEASCLGILSATKGVSEGGVIFASTVMAQGGFQIEVESITATGQYVISGAPATIRGTSGGVFRRFGFTGSYDANAFSTDTLVAFGSSVLPISLTFPTIVAGQYSIVDIHGSSLVVTGSLDVDGASAQVAGSLITRGSGSLTMTDATDSLVVGGDLRFGGSGSAGQLTAGVLHAMADVFIDIASAVRADSAHVLWMSAATTTLTVSDSASNRLGSLRLSGSTIAGFSGVAAKFAGDVVLSDAASFVVSGTQEMEIAGRLVDPAGSSFLATTILTGTNAIATPEFGADRLILRGSNALSANFAVIGGLWIESGGNLAPNTWSVDITDSLITSGTGIITMNSPEDTITVLRAALFNGGASVLTAGYLRVQARFDVGSQQGFQGQPGHTTEFFQVNNQQLGFSYPGFGPAQSHFGRVLLNKSGGAPTSSTAIFVNGQVVTANTAQVWAGVGQATPLTIRGSDISALSLPNQPLIIVDGADITNLTGLLFTGFNQAGTTQLRVERSGGTVPLVSPTFDSTAAEPTTYIFADDVADDANTLTVTVTNPAPGGHGGRIGTDGTAQISGWNTFAAIQWQGSVSNDWADPANWVQGVAPSQLDSAEVTGAGFSPQITAAASVGALVWLRAQSLSLGAQLEIRSSLGGSAEGSLVTCSPSGSIRFVPTDSARMSASVACPVRVSSGVLRPSGQFFVDSLIVDGSGEFHLRSGTANVSQLLRTAGNGRLRMDGGELRVQGNAVFAGASTAGTLTAGTLTVHSSFTQLATNSPASFAPSGSHRTVLGDSTGFAIDLPFTLGFASTASSWFNELYVPGGWYEITSAARSRGRADVFVSLQGRRFTADSGFYAASGNVTLEHLSVAGVLEVPIGFTADTVEFRGPVGGDPSQVIPASDGEASLPYQHVIVRGANIGMTDLTGFPYQISDLLHVASGSLLLGASVEVFADTATLDVTGSASLLWDASPPFAVRFDSVRIATSTPVAPSSGSLEFRSFSQVGLGNFQPSGSFLATKNLIGVIDFDDESGGAYFSNLRFSQNAIATLTSSVIVNGTLSRVNNTGTVNIQSNQLDLNSRVLTVNGGLGFPAGGEQSTRFRNVRLHLTGDYSAPTSLEFNNIRFERMDPNPTPAFLLSEHTGTAAVTWQNIVFDSPLESGLFFQWDAVGSGSITFQNASPALDCLIGTCTPGDVAPTGVAGAALVWEGSVSPQWTNAANWSPTIVPTFTSSVTIPDATTTLNDPLLDANTDIGSLTVQANGVLNIDVSDTLNVFGNMTVDGVVNAGNVFSAIRLRTTASGARSISATGGIGTRLVVAGDAVLVGRTNLSATAFQSGLFLQAGRLDLNGNTLDIAGSFRSHGNATLRMNDPLDTLIVDQNFEIGGGSTLGLLTEGEIVYSGVYFRQFGTNSSTAFAATLNHSTRFSGDQFSDVWFDTPDSTLSRFANLAFDRTGDQFLYLDYSPVFATNLTRVSGSIEVFSDGDLIVSGSVSNVDPEHLFWVFDGTYVDLLGVDPQTCDGLTFNVEFALANFRPVSCHSQLYDFAVEAGTANVRTNGMFALSDTQIWAVGENGSIQFGNNVSWTTQTSPTANELYAVHGTSSTNIWAVGAGGTILRFDGSAWTSTASNTEQTLRGVFAVSATSAFAVGDGGTILEYNGSGWTAVTSPTAQDLYSVYQASGSDMIASGAGGTALRLNLGAWGLTVTNTTALLAATWTTPGEYYLVGANGSILTRYNFFGPAWFEVESPTVNPLNALSGNSLAAFAVGNNGTILQKLGESFAQVNSPTISNLRGTAVTPNGTAYVAGDNGVILKALAPLP